MVFLSLGGYRQAPCRYLSDDNTKVQRKSPGSNSNRGFNTILTHHFFDDNSVIFLFDDN